MEMEKFARSTLHIFMFVMVMENRVVLFGQKLITNELVLENLVDMNTF